LQRGVEWRREEAEAEAEAEGEVDVGNRDGSKFSRTRECGAGCVERRMETAVGSGNGIGVGLGLPSHCECELSAVGAGGDSLSARRRAQNCPRWPQQK